MIDPQSLLRRIAKAVQDLGAATERYKTAIAEARAAGIERAESEATYKRIRHQHELDHDGTIPERKAAGEVAANPALKEWRTKEVLYDSAREACWLAKHEVENARAVLSAVQTASALVRAEADAMRQQT